MTVLRGGVIGFGNIGQKVAEYINQIQESDARIVAAVDIAQPERELAADSYGLVVADDVPDLLAMDLDFVVVVSPNHVHADQVVLAAQAGKHIFCEKPIALTLDDADRMIQAVEEAGVINVVNYSLRFIDGYLKIKQMVEQGEVGEILMAWHFMTRGYGLHASGARHWAVVNPEHSGGWTVHHACHSVDFLHWLNGPIASAYCNTRTTVPDSSSEEVLLGNLTFANGAIGMVGDSTCVIREHHTGVIGSRGSLLMSGEHDSTILRFHGEGESEERLISARDSKRPGGGLDHFLDCLRSGRSSPHSLRVARHSLAVALAMQESAHSSAVVSIPAPRQ